MVHSKPDWTIFDQEEICIPNEWFCLSMDRTKCCTPNNTGRSCCSRYGRLFSQYGCSVSPIHAFVFVNVWMCIKHNNYVFFFVLHQCPNSCNVRVVERCQLGCSNLFSHRWYLLIFSYFSSYRGNTSQSGNLFTGCSTQYYCGDCRTQQYCGWCLEESNCSTSAHCWVKQRTWVASDCPCKKKKRSSHWIFFNFFWYHCHFSFNFVW